MSEIARRLQALGLQSGDRMAGFVHIGRTDNAPVERERPSLDQIVTRF